jgi:hypothetical protein
MSEPVEHLLTIDLDAAVRKLSEERFKTPGESILELVRLVSGMKPSEVRLSLTAKRVVIQANAVRVDEELMELLALLLDSEGPIQLRQHALNTLEREFGLEALAAFQGQPRSVRFEWSNDMRPAGLKFQRGQRPKRYQPADVDGLVIAMRGRMEHLEASRFIKRRCRYSNRPIFLNGRRISQGGRLNHCLIQVDLSNARMKGTIGLPDDGELTTLVRLDRGIVREESYFPAVRGLLFSAILEERDSNTKATNGTLGRAANRLYLKLAKSYERLNDADKVRAEELLFKRYRFTGEPELLEGVRTFKRCNGEPLDYFELQALARQTTLYTIPHDAAPTHFAVRNRVVLRLDQRQRRYLDMDPKIPTKEVGRRVQLRSFRTRIHSLARTLTDWPSKLMGVGNKIDDALLEPAEARFLKAVRAEILSGGFILPNEGLPFGISICMAERRYRPWVCQGSPDGPSEYSLARRHPIVKSIIRAFELDPDYLYVALFLLTNGHDGYSENRGVAQRGIIARRGTAGVG